MYHDMVDTYSVVFMDRCWDLTMDEKRRDFEYAQQEFSTTSLTWWDIVSLGTIQSFATKKGIAVFLNGKDITMWERTLCGQTDGLIQRIPQGRHHSENQEGVIYSEMHRDR